MRDILCNVEELPTTDTAALSRLARRAGYNNAAAGTLFLTNGSKQYYIWVEDSVTDTKAQILNAISGLTDNVITLSNNEINLMGDGQSTATITITGVPNDQLRLNYQGILPLNSIRPTLDNTGKFDLIIGPFPQGFMLATPVTIQIAALNKLSKYATLTVNCS